jgi:hypothetical protein
VQQRRRQRLHGTAQRRRLGSVSAPRRVLRSRARARTCRSVSVVGSVIAPPPAPPARDSGSGGGAPRSGACSVSPASHALRTAAGPRQQRAHMVSCAAQARRRA